ncbi:MAG: substrate-binding domain-containing protein [Alphaproteobacteria bacterium]|nr:substrate-binding domain-containing protein [Alphaproteobacteria bacterium]
MKKIVGLAFLCFVTLFTTAAFAETVSVHGSTVLLTSLLEPNKEAIQKDSGLTLDIVGNSAGNGLVDLVQGKADVAMIASSLADVASKVNAKTPGTVDVAALKAFEVGKTRIAFAVHPSNPVKALTQTQISDILKGKIVNWKEVGGEDKVILVATGAPLTGLRTTVEKDFTGGEPIAANKRELSNTSMIGKLVSQLPDVLGVVTDDLINPSIRELTLDKKNEITLYYVTKGEPSPAAKKLIDATLKYAKKK